MLGAVRCPAAASSCPAQARSPHSHILSAQATSRVQRRAPAGDWSYLEHSSEASYGAETRKGTCFLPPLLFTPVSFCFYVNMPQTTSSSRCQSKPVLCPALNCCKGVAQTSAVFQLHPQIQIALRKTVLVQMRKAVVKDMVSELTPTPLMY